MCKFYAKMSDFLILSFSSFILSSNLIVPFKSDDQDLATSTVRLQSCKEFLGLSCVGDLINILLVNKMCKWCLKVVILLPVNTLIAVNLFDRQLAYRSSMANLEPIL